MDYCAQVADHLLIVSMNFTPTDWFWFQAEQAARNHALATFFVNTSQASALTHNDGIDLAFWLLPAGLSGLARNEVYRRCRPEDQDGRNAEFCELPADEPGRVKFEANISSMMLDI